MKTRRTVLTAAAALAATGALAQKVKIFPPPGGSAAPSTIGGVYFDGASAALHRASLTATNSSVLSFSYWTQIQPSGEGSIWAVDPEITYINHANEDVFIDDLPNYVVSLGNAGATAAASATIPMPADQVWNHYLFSADMAHASGSKVMKLYINGVDSSPTIVDADASFTMTFNALSLWVGSKSDGTLLFNGDMAEFWFAPNQSLLTAGAIPPATIAKFYSGGHPVDLGAAGATPTGTAPAVFFHRAATAAASTFATNLGTGGAFTLTGTLTNSVTNP